MTTSHQLLMLHMGSQTVLRIDFMILLLTFKALNSLASGYIVKTLTPCSHVYQSLVPYA